MRSRGLNSPNGLIRPGLPTLLLVVVALLASSCIGSDPQPPSVDRTVDDSERQRETEAAIQRTLIIEHAMEDGLGRTAAGCTIDTALETGEIELEDLENIDFSAQTGSGASGSLAAILADALIECGPSLREKLAADLPGALSIPATHSVESDCVVNAYVELWRDLYADRFGDRRLNNEVPEELDVSDRLVGIMAGCDAAGAVVLGASNTGHLDTFALSTLEWECLAARIDPADFLPAFPFPEEPGDALDRMGASVLPDVTFCRAWVSGEAEAEDAAPDQ